MRLSVVICTRNRADMLRACLSRLANVEPDRRDIELVLVDNGSSDHTTAVIHDSLRTLPFESHAVFEAGLGLSRARNAGIAHSTVRIHPPHALANAKLCHPIETVDEVLVASI